MHQAVGWFCGRNSDCAPPGRVIAPHPELEKAWLFGRRSWPPPAPESPLPLSSPAAANRPQHAVVIGHIQAAGEEAVCRDAKTDCMCLFSSSVGFVVVFAA